MEELVQFLILSIIAYLYDCPFILIGLGEKYDGTSCWMQQLIKSSY
jgi:hypothetical protein